MKEKEKRNIEIYLRKEGLARVEDKKPTREPATYRQLSRDYDLSITRLQRIVNRMRKRYDGRYQNYRNKTFLSKVIKRLERTVLFL